MSIVTPIIAVILGALAIALNRHFVGPKLFEQIIIGVVVLVVVIWLLGLLGVMDWTITPLRS